MWDQKPETTGQNEGTQETNKEPTLLEPPDGSRIADNLNGTPNLDFEYNKCSGKKPLSQFCV